MDSLTRKALSAIKRLKNIEEEVMTDVKNGNFQSNAERKHVENLTEFILESVREEVAKSLARSVSDSISPREK